MRLLLDTNYLSVYRTSPITPAPAMANKTEAALFITAALVGDPVVLVTDGPEGFAVADPFAVDVTVCVVALAEVVVLVNVVELSAAQIFAGMVPNAMSLLVVMS
jgi:hypothetical protein